MADAVDVLREWVRAWTATPDELDAHVTEGYAHHAMSGAELDLEGFRRGLALVLSGFPDVSYEIVHPFTQHDLAGAYLIATGTHAGSFLGLAPTASRVVFRGILHVRVDAGRIAEDWDVFDLLNPAFALGGSVVRADAAR